MNRYLITVHEQYYILVRSEPLYGRCSTSGDREVAYRFSKRDADRYMHSVVRVGAVLEKAFAVAEEL